MSAIAGRVLLIPKGNYDSTATYTMLDMVVYNGSSYICKQECTGVVPTNTTYWMLNASGSAVAYLNDIGDVVITNVANRQVLMYDSATQKWVNGTITTTLAGLSDTQISSATDGQVLKYNSTSQKWVNGEDKGGILPHLIVISETGSTVTATKGQTVITATETSTGHFECDLPEFGTWTIDAILGGDDAQVSLVVDTVKVYTVDDSHFHATVTVKYPSGATCRLQSADETLYATGSPYTFTVHHAETYTITVTYNQRIYTDTVTFTTEGQSFSKTLPTPSEVDANDINWWLFFGGVSGSYSSLADILADSTALATLMASTDAVDYLVRCKEWIENKGLVPVMTSATTPSGVVSASGSRYNDRQLPYMVFDGDLTTEWQSSELANHWIQYEFETAQVIRRLYIDNVKHATYASYIPSLAIKMQGSNDGSSFVDLGNTTATFTETGNVGVSGVSVDLSFNNTVAYKYYRVVINPNYSGSTVTTCNILSNGIHFCADANMTDNQTAMTYIGLNNYASNTLLADSTWLNAICNSTYFESVLNVKVPVMTSNTTPSGQVLCSSNLSTDTQWYAFDGIETSARGWNSGVEVNPWIAYMFTQQEKIYKAYINPYGEAYEYAPHSAKIQASTDANTWIDVSNDISMPQDEIQNIILTNNNPYQYFRVYVTSQGTGGRSTIREVQFYGRADI